jgi:hypothetical protein
MTADQRARRPSRPGAVVCGRLRRAKLVHCHRNSIYCSAPLASLIGSVKPLISSAKPPPGSSLKGTPVVRGAGRGIFPIEAINRPYRGRGLDPVEAGRDPTLTPTPQRGPSYVHLGRGMTAVPGSGSRCAVAQSWRRPRRMDCGIASARLPWSLVLACPRFRNYCATVRRP